MMRKDAFAQWWEWANKPPASELMIPVQIHDAVMTLTEEQRQDRAMVNAVVRKAVNRTAPPAVSLRPFTKG